MSKPRRDSRHVVLHQMVLGVGLTAITALQLAGCANKIDPEALATGALEAIPATAIALASGTKTPVGSPTEVYARVARGAHSCWLGGPGGLGRTYAFHAVSEPRHNNKGGQSKIIIYRRPQATQVEKSSTSDQSDTADQPARKGTQAFRIRITPQGASAAVEAENIKMQADIGERMIADTHRWAAGEEGCIEGGLTEGWGTKLDASSQPPRKKAKKASRTR